MSTILGIYDNWPDTDAHVTGVSGASCKSYTTKGAAKSAQTKMEKSGQPPKGATSSAVSTTAAAVTPAEPTGQLQDESISDDSILASADSIVASTTSNHAPPPLEKTSSDRNTTCSSCSHVTVALQQALTRLSALEMKQTVLEDENRKGKLALLKAQEEIKSLQSSSAEIMSTLGPRIGAIERRVDKSLQNALPTPPTTGQHMQSRRPSGTSAQSSSSWADVAAPTETPGTRTGDAPATAAAPVQVTRPVPATRPTRPHLQFDHTKCIVIHNVKDLAMAKRDDALKRMLGKMDSSVIIDRIMRYGAHNPKIMCQLANSNMVEALISNWDNSILGGCCCRRPQSSPVESTTSYGIAKGVPLDLSDQDMQDDIVNAYHGATAFRLVRGPTKQRLRTVKIKFANSLQLQAALRDGILLASISVCVRVEEPDPRPRVTQCFNCRGFAHIAANCDRAYKCVTCGQSHDSRPTQECNEPPTCVNCKGAHRADDHRNCSVYNRHVQRTTSRHQNA